MELWRQLQPSPFKSVQVDQQRQSMLASAVMHQEQVTADTVCDCHALLGQKTSNGLLAT